MESETSSNYKHTSKKEELIRRIIEDDIETSDISFSPGLTEIGNCDLCEKPIFDYAKKIRLDKKEENPRFLHAQCYNWAKDGEFIPRQD